MTIPPRQSWCHALSALALEDLQHQTAALAGALTITDVGLPQSGLALLALRDGAFQESFNLGEVPLAQAHVSVRAADGREAHGGAVVLEDQVELARTLAILDAVLAGRLPGWEQVAQTVARGAALRAQEQDERNRILARTRVDFSVFGREQEDDEEEE